MARSSQVEAWKFVRNSLLGLVTAALMAGCADVPTAAAVRECSELGAEIAAVEQAKRAAVGQTARRMEVVIPLAIAARCVGGKSAAAEADKRLNELRGAYARQACAQGSES